MLTLALIAMAVMGANAQISLGKIKNRVKNKVENKVENTVNSAVDNAVDGAVDKATDKAKKKAKKAAKKVAGDKVSSAVGLGDDNQSSGSVSSSGFDYLNFWKKTFEPTEEALKNDGWAGNTTKLDYQTKTMKELHAAWDHLPEAYFPFHPYYTKGNSVWYSFDGSYSATLTMRWMDYMKRCLMLPVGAALQENTYFKPDGKDYYMPLDGTFRSAYTADFIVDPKGSGPYGDFVRLLCFSKQYYCTEIEYQMDKPEEGLIHDDWFIYKGSQQKYREWIAERENMCVDLATEVTPISVVQNDIIKGFETFNNTKANILGRLCYGIKAIAGYNRILKYHKDYKEDDETNQKIKRLMVINEDKVRQLSIDFINLNKPAVSAPKGVSVDANTRTKATAQAKGYVGADKFVRIIFESGSWRAFKESKWPYRVVNYVIPVAVVAKGDNGKQVIHFCDLGKSPDGKVFTIQASNTKDPGPFPLK